MDLFRTLPDGFGGTERCLCLSNDPPIRLRRINAAQSMASTGELPIAELADDTLNALQADDAVPEELRAACEAEMHNRESGGANEGADDDLASIRAKRDKLIAQRHKEMNGTKELANRESPLVAASFNQPDANRRSRDELIERRHREFARLGYRQS